MKKFIVVFFVLFSNFSFAAYCQCAGTGSQCWASLNAAISAFNPAPSVYSYLSVRSTWQHSATCTGYNVWFATSQGNINYERPDHSVVFYLSGASDPTPTPTPTPANKCAEKVSFPQTCAMASFYSKKPPLGFCASDGCYKSVTFSYVSSFSTDTYNGNTIYNYSICSTYTGNSCTPSSDPNAPYDLLPTPFPSVTRPGAYCPDDKVLTYVNDKPYCYSPAGTPSPTGPNTTKAPTPKPSQASTTSATQTTVVTNPDGSVTTTTKTTNPDGSTSTTTTTVNKDGSKKSTTTTTGPTRDGEDDKEEGECSKPDMKNTIGCQTVNVKPGEKSKFETDKEKENINAKKNEFQTEFATIRDSLKAKLGATVSAAGSPKSYSFKVFGGSFNVDLAYYQQMFTKIASMVIAVAYIVAVFIILS